MHKIVVTGAAGLVGQNLVARLKARNDLQLVGIDKHQANVRLFRRIHPETQIIEADLSSPGEWMNQFSGADAVIINQAQIGGLNPLEFEANNVTATKQILSAVDANRVPYFVGVSSSVVNSRADDLYTRSKSAQERLFEASTVPHVILRPTLMFGWFDRKHLGWLRRFMDRTRLFPIPGKGNYVRQPLYVGDFVSIIVAAVDRKKTGTFDISGLEQITYANLIDLIHEIVKPRARVVHIPYSVFWLLLWSNARINRDPPFTTNQLEALVIPETFPVIDWPKEFRVEPTPLRQALSDTFLDPKYSNVTLSF